MILVYVLNDVVYESRVTQEFINLVGESDAINQVVPSNASTYLVNPDIPAEPIEAWYIENGEIKINQQKLIKFNRTRMPTLPPIEFDIKLNENGLYDAVQALIADNFELRVAYTRATFFKRTDPFIDQARQLLGLTDEQVDAMWELHP